MQNKIDETDNLIYDDRRKILIQKKSQTTENLTDEVKKDDKVEKESERLSTVKQSMEVEYTEEGIKLAYNNLVEEKEFHEKQIVKVKDNLKDAGEMTEDLIELKAKLEKLAKLEQTEKQKKDLEAQEERLKEVNKQIKQIKDTIGTRLKL